jgi:hypothetical protein
MKLRLLQIACVVLTVLTFKTSAATLYVSLASTNPVPPYAGWSTAATNIQDAVDAANAGDLILATNGVYATGGRVVYGSLSNRVVVNKAVTIQSINGAGATMIAGSQFNQNGGIPIRCVYLTNGAALIGFTLTNGNASPSGDPIQEQSGGGTWCESSSTIVSDCIFSGNFAYQFGGGAFRGTLINCALTNNSASYIGNSGGGGGGGAASNNLFDCNITGDSAYSYGGGAYGCALSNCLIVGNRSITGQFPGNGGGTAYSTLLNCTVSNNVAGASGGGVFMGIANGCLISSNSAFIAGGGAYSNALVNCVLHNNLSSSIGGGAYQSALVNCTVVSNAASGPSVQPAGGGVYGGGATNCIIYYNSALKDPNLSGSPSVIYCCTTPLPAGLGNITNEPGLVNLTSGDFHLQSNAPCINSGNNTYVTSAADLDGNPRIVGGTVDIGAYEYQTPTSVLSYAWAQQYSLPTDGSVDYADLDGTGFTVYQDWIAGLNPTNALSVLAMLPPAPTNNPVGLVISWESVSNRTYFLQSSSNLAMRPAFSTIQSNLVGQPSTTSYTDTSATNAGPYFYRVGVQQ